MTGDKLLGSRRSKADPVGFPIGNPKLNGKAVFILYTSVQYRHGNAVVGHLTPLTIEQEG
jgi:hypothetical protein